jgi:hypothetical protein
MRKKKIIEKPVIQPIEGSDYDPFLRRILLQGTVLKKLLAEVDQFSKTEAELINEGDKNMDSLELENKDDRKY